ncbi:O-antigen ligase family protein [Saccharopolyspora sp. K220]|uniref:O-antigen ligase family protein n=1 Tax=Saccharopolyspora soli TaxID=2926618 RepID=UPI001F57CA90|nr:O-antigen ligase family protein [Saccharopolyspora soli]MCI2418255.1 O-antigen ligase family protein [Saccharopolyspora soli]
MSLVVLESASGFLPGDPLISILTPLRLIILFGLVGLLFDGARGGTFRTRLDIPIAVLVLAAVIATVFGGGTSPPLRGLLTQVAVYYLIVGLRRRQPGSWRAAAVLALASVSMAGAVAFSQATNGTPTGFCRRGLLGDADCAPGLLIRSIGTFANPNTLAAFLVLLAPIATVAVTLFAERSTRTSVMILAGGMGYGAVLTTFSRAGYIAAAAGILVLVMARLLIPRLSRSQVHLATGVGVSGLASVGLLIAIGSRAGNALGVRGQAWEAAIDVALSNPLGVGLQRAGEVIDARAPGDVEFSHVHNLWLNWLVEAGFLGLVGITAITVVGVVTAARLARDSSPTGAACLSALTAFLLMSVLDHPANLERIAMMFWLVLALTMGEAPVRWRGESKAAGSPVKPERPAPSPVPGRLAPGRPRTHPGQRPRPAQLPSPEPDPIAETRPVPRVRDGSRGSAPARPVRAKRPEPGADLPRPRPTDRRDIPPRPRS